MQGGARDAEGGTDENRGAEREEVQLVIIVLGKNTVLFMCCMFLFQITAHFPPAVPPAPLLPLPSAESLPPLPLAVTLPPLPPAARPPVPSPALTRARRRLLAERESSAQQQEEIPIDLVCKVCYITKKNAAIIFCGHQFCRQCADRVKRESGFCPMCKQPIQSILPLFD